MVQLLGSSLWIPKLLPSFPLLLLLCSYTFALSKDPALYFTGADTFDIHLEDIYETFPDSCDVSEFPKADTIALCSFIKTHCSTSMFSLSLHYYCTTSSCTRAFLILLATLILVLFFLSFALITQHFLYPNLALLSQLLQISPKVAGLTLLALGNAAPDIFSTYSAMSHHSAALALGELVGAANFVVCVVVGGMGIVKPFAVEKERFGYDLSMFGGLVGLAFYFISDKKLKNWECAVMVFGYLLYIFYQIFFVDELEEPDRLEEGLLTVPDDGHDTQSVSSLDDNQIKGFQPVGIIEAQRIWRLKHEEDEETPLIRPGMSRAFKSTEQIRTHVSAGHLPLKKTLTSDRIETEAIPTFIVDPTEESSDQADTTADGIAALNDHTWWKFMFSPWTDDEPRTIFTVITTPILIVLNFLNPVFPCELFNHPQEYAREIQFKERLFYVQLTLIPSFFIYTLSDDFNFIQALIITLLTAIISIWVPHKILIPVLGFLSSILLILVISSHLITLLKNLGVIMRMPESLLGLTILAIGNSTGDLVSNLTLAGLDMGVVGLSACLGGPLLYILFGIGVNGMIINGANGTDHLKLQMDDNFKISGFGLGLILIFYAVVIPLNGWKIDRRVGIIGILWWCLVTSVNIYVSV